MEGVKRILRSSAIIRKTIELVIATVCLSLVLDAYVNGAVPQWKNVKITYVTCCWCIIISTMAILCLMAGQMLPDLAMTALSAVGGMLFILSGQETLSCWIDEKDYKLSDKQIVSNSLPSLGWIIGMHQVRAAGMLCLLLGAVHILDAVITLLSREKSIPDCPKSISDASLYSSNTMIPYRYRKPYYQRCYPNISKMFKLNKNPPK